MKKTEEQCISMAEQLVEKATLNVNCEECVKSFDASTRNPEEVEILKMMQDDGESVQDILEATYHEYNKTT